MIRRVVDVGRRIRLVFAGLRADRNRPDIDELGDIDDPGRFVWTVLPHAARSFAASIAVLDEDHATTAAVGYLYCRILDTYEDLSGDLEGQLDGLRSFADRFAAQPPAPAPPLRDPRLGDDRDRVHALLIERCRLIDVVYAERASGHQALIRKLVDDMAAGMVWSAGAFAGQGGVLTGDEQLLRYCRNVIGHPALFVMSLLGTAPVGPEQETDAWAVSEMIQLANVTRDIEKDLQRGIAYDPLLRPYLGGTGDPVERDAAIRQSRQRLTVMALQRVPAFHRLYAGFAEQRPSTRLAGVLLLLFTDRHYRAMARRVGAAPWPGPRRRIGIYVRALPSLVSTRMSERIVARIQRRSLEAATRLQPGST